MSASTRFRYVRLADAVERTTETCDVCGLGPAELDAWDEETRRGNLNKQWWKQRRRIRACCACESALAHHRPGPFPVATAQSAETREPLTDLTGCDV